MSHLNMRLSPAQRLANRKADKAYRNYVSDCPGYGTNDKGNRLVWFNGTDALARVWRFVGYADEIICLRHTGYFADCCQKETMRGIVAQLPARNGECQYLAGRIHSCDGTILFEIERGCIYADKEDASRAADSIAGYAAESERDYQMKESAKMRVDELRADNREMRKEIASLKKIIREKREEIARNKKQIARVQDDPSVLFY